MWDRADTCQLAPSLPMLIPVCITARLYHLQTPDSPNSAVRVSPIKAGSGGPHLGREQGNL
jgi:hypothetical protein